MCLAVASGIATAASANDEPFLRHVDVGVTLESKLAVGFDAPTFQTLQLTALPAIEVELPGGVSFTLLGRLRADPADELDPGGLNQQEISPASRRLNIGTVAEAELREAYFDFAIAQTTFRIGKQQIVWGQADGLKVLDVVNPQDFREFILDRFEYSRVPLWSLAAETRLPGDVYAQIVWLPDQSYHILPKPGAAYFLTSPVIVPVSPPGIPVDVEKFDRPNRVVADSDAGLRLSTFLRGWDLTVNYLYHYADLPVFVRTVLTTDGRPAVNVRPEYRRTHLLGGTFANAFGNLTVRGEVAFSFQRFVPTTDSQDPDGVVETDQLGAVLGLDWQGFRETLLSVQVFPDWITRHRAGVERDAVEWNATLLVRRELWNDTLELQAIWLTNLNRGDGLLRPKVSYEMTDALALWGGFDIFYGTRRGVFGQFDDRSRVVFGIELTL